MRHSSDRKARRDPRMLTETAEAREERRASAPAAACPMPRAQAPAPSAHRTRQAPPSDRLWVGTSARVERGRLCKTSCFVTWCFVHTTIYVRKPYGLISISIYVLRYNARL